MDLEGTRNVVIAFNDCINRRDIDGLASLMTDDHVFIDSENSSLSGKDRMISAWTRFFDAFPDYCNIFESISVDSNLAVIVGRSDCSDDRLNGPALWTAKIDGERIGEWRVYEDTHENRSILGIIE